MRIRPLIAYDGSAEITTLTVCRERLGKSLAWNSSWRDRPDAVAGPAPRT
jgi:hypothetical protein